jgi:hypothetical protein
MMISGCTVSRNSANQLGGGIVNEGYGSMTITGSTVSRNDATSWGGGIFTNSQGTLFISNSLVCSNSAGLGADLINFNCGLVNIVNSTICKTFTFC